MSEQSRISDERLAELIEWHSAGIRATAKLDTIDALRELVLMREALKWALAKANYHNDSLLMLADPPKQLRPILLAAVGSDK